MDKVSLLVPVHNGARHLRGALESALSQGPVVGEIIVGDDASTDETAQVLAEFRGPVRVVHSIRRLGLTSNHNRLLPLAVSPWLSFLHQDDLLEPGSVEARLSAADPGTSFVASASSTIDEDGRTSGLNRSAALTRCAGPLRPPFDRTAPRWGALACFLAGNPIHMGTALLHQRLVSSVGSFDERLTYAMDYEYWLRCLTVSPLRYVEVPSLRYRHSPGQATARYHIDGGPIANRAGRKEIARALALAWRWARSTRRDVPPGIAARWLLEILYRSAGSDLPDDVVVRLIRAVRRPPDTIAVA